MMSRYLVSESELEISVACLIKSTTSILSAKSMDISAARKVEEKLEYPHIAPGNEILCLLHTATDSTQLVPLLYFATRIESRLLVSISTRMGCY